MRRLVVAFATLGACASPPVATVGRVPEPPRVAPEPSTTTSATSTVALDTGRQTPASGHPVAGPGPAVDPDDMPSPQGHSTPEPDEVWRALSDCESGSDPAKDTGNGYYGAFQFSASTWRSVGEAGLPHQFPYAHQLAAARRLRARSGWGQWPACSRRLGLV